MWWSIYHYVLNIIGAAIVVVLLAVGWIKVSGDPDDRVSRLGRWLNVISDAVASLVFILACGAVLLTLLFWCVYPMTPDYARHSTPDTVCAPVGFVSDNHREPVWITPDVC